MHIKLKDSQKFENSKNCTVQEYKLPSKNLSAATAIINGRYPDKGRSVNIKCEQTYYVISGVGIIHSEKGDFKISKGDLYFFEKEEKYWVEGKQLFVYMSNSPAWYPEQYKSTK